MSLLTDVIAGVLGGSSGGSGMQGALTNLLAGSQYGQRQGQDYPAQSGGFGGLTGLVAAFQQAGLGNIVQSWISGGPNQPVSPDQLQNVLGQDRVHSMAQQAGMPPQSLLAQLSEHLPKAVDQMTPDGRLPDEPTVSV